MLFFLAGFFFLNGSARLVPVPWDSANFVGKLPFGWFLRKKYPGIPNSLVNLEIWNILAMPQKTALSCATCLVFWLFVFLGFLGFFALTSPSVIHLKERHLTTHTASNRTNICYVLVVKVLKTIRYEI